LAGLRAAQSQLVLRSMTRMTQVVVALLTLLMILVISGFFYLVSTFLFAFSGGQYRMVDVVNYAALIVIALMIALTAIVWKVRSPISATKFSAIGTPIAWVVAMVGEWSFSQFVFVTGAP
jgi:uncharacterized membrane protein